MSQIDQANHVPGLKAAELQLAPVGNEGPDFATLKSGYENTLAKTQSFVDQTRQNQLDDSLWRDIPGYDGYQAHPEGFVRSCWKHGGDVRKNGKTKGDKWRILKGSGGIGEKWGYRLIFMGRNASETLHRLIAITFIPNPENKRTVNHKNGNRGDSRVENLEWSTYQEQHLHRCRVLKHGRGSGNGMAELKEDDVLNIVSLLGFGARACDLAVVFNISRTAIYHIRHGFTWGHVTGLSAA